MSISKSNFYQYNLHSLVIKCNNKGLIYLLHHKRCFEIYYLKYDSYVIKIFNVQWYFFSYVKREVYVRYYKIFDALKVF
jgi:hypothetical protein